MTEMDKPLAPLSAVLSGAASPEPERPESRSRRRQPGARGGRGALELALAFADRLEHENGCDDGPTGWKQELDFDL